MIISIACQKGGTGKTTTAITVATGFGKLRKKILMDELVTPIATKWQQIGNS